MNADKIKQIVAGILTLVAALVATVTAASN